jgi:hypothetical protein
MEWYEAVDLEKLNKLAEENPEGFEKKVQAIIAKVIINCSEESRKIQSRINKSESFYVADLPDNPIEFEIERRNLIDGLLKEVEDEEAFSIVNELQAIVDGGLNKALFNLKKFEELGESDLDLFEKEKEILILRYILSQPQEKRLKAKQFQWKIDATLQKSKNRLDRLMLMERLFYEGVYGEGGFVDAPKELGPANQRLQQAVTQLVGQVKKEEKRSHLKVVK